MLDSTAFPYEKQDDRPSESLFFECFSPSESKPGSALARDKTKNSEISSESSTKTDEKKVTSPDTGRSQDKTKSHSDAETKPSGKVSEQGTAKEASAEHAPAKDALSKDAETKKEQGKRLETEKHSEKSGQTPNKSNDTKLTKGKGLLQSGERISKEDEEKLSPSQKLLASSIKNIRENDLPQLRRRAEQNPELKEALDDLEKKVQEYEDFLEHAQQQRIQREQERLEEAKRDKEAAIAVVEFGLNNFDKFNRDFPDKRLNSDLLSLTSVYGAEANVSNWDPDANTDRYRELTILIRKIGGNHPVNSGFPFYRSEGVVKAASRADLESHLKKLKAN